MNSVNFVWDFQDKVWDEKYQKLIDWKNHYPNPLKWPSQRSAELVEHELAVWLLKIRGDYKKGILGDNRLNKLLTINFSFEPYSDKWSAGYKNLKEFIEKNNRFPTTEKKEIKNYMWLRNQINNFSKLEQNQQKLLNDIKYQDFGQYGWNQSYNKLVSFIKKHNRLPKTERSSGSEEKNLYIWLLGQRKSFRNNHLEKNQIDLLLTLKDINNFLILKNGKRQMRSLSKSLAHCKELLKFRRDNQERWPSATSNNNQERKLALWIQYIKNWHNGKLVGYNELPKELYNELLKIGFDPSLELGNRWGKWDYHHNKILEILKNGGALDKKSYTWLYNQKDRLEKGKLNLDRKQQIECLVQLALQKINKQ